MRCTKVVLTTNTNYIEHTYRRNRSIKIDICIDAHYNSICSIGYINVVT